jgi:hypothetical protein
MPSCGKAYGCALKQGEIKALYELIRTAKRSYFE